MKPKPGPKTHHQPLIATMRLDLTIDMDHELVRLAQTISYGKLMEQAFRKHGGHAKAKQVRRALKVLKSMKTMAGRVMQNVERKISNVALEAHKSTLNLSELILSQKRTTKGKLYSLHAPEVECIAMGKAHRPYEFGVKPCLLTWKLSPSIGRLQEQFEIGSRSFARPANLWAYLVKTSRSTEETCPQTHSGRPHNS